MSIRIARNEHHDCWVMIGMDPVIIIRSLFRMHVLVNTAISSGGYYFPSASARGAFSTAAASAASVMHVEP